MTYTQTWGLISKFLSIAFAKCDIPGLEYHSSAMGHLFKSGFGRFGLGQVVITHTIYFWNCIYFVLLINL